jgi:urease accessory protein UreH
MDNDYVKYNLESMYQYYLRTTKLDEDLMSPSQRLERKRMWMAGFHMAMITILADSPDEDDEFAKMLDSLREQMLTFTKQTVEEGANLEKCEPNFVCLKIEFNGKSEQDSV